MRAVGEIPSSTNLRLQNLVESQLEITKTESYLIALSAKFALQKSSRCFSPRTPYILAPRYHRRVDENALTNRRFGRARSLRSDRAERTLGRYVATERMNELSVAT
ncbi:hypothetical protein DY000_02031735 [Brassica cretica]|uniref:Uncharacterized protein n=1 Tax=Brassica cretica TaxID=69181 RepID=A0ABQ7DNF7_BRACR|nr:hypothetical protein DY000_02031735 [Brassica cretica]